MVHRVVGTIIDLFHVNSDFPRGNDKVLLAKNMLSNIQAKYFSVLWSVLFSLIQILPPSTGKQDMSGTELPLVSKGAVNSEKLHVNVCMGVCVNVMRVYVYIKYT